MRITFLSDNAVSSVYLLCLDVSLFIEAPAAAAFVSLGSHLPSFLPLELSTAFYQAKSRFRPLPSIFSELCVG